MCVCIKHTIRTYCNVAAIYSLVGVVGVVGNGYKPV